MRIISIETGKFLIRLTLKIKMFRAILFGGKYVLELIKGICL